MKITLEELANDETFFKDLREGNFVLVLGAGFSCGMRNCVEEGDIEGINQELVRLKCSSLLTYDDCKKIPLGDEFKLISNTIFLKNYSDYHLCANEWNKNNFKLNSSFDISSFFAKLFTPDKAIVHENISTLKSILIPNWHNIYIFNFDTLLENIINEIKPTKEYDIKSYPDDKGLINKTTNTSIGHLHGIITTTDLSKLVLSDKSYSDLDKSTQSLYDYLHSEIAHGKKLLVLGTQLHEGVINNKLFHDIKNDITIYHFDIKHDDFCGLDIANKNNNCKLVTLIDSDGNIGTKVFLQFLHANKSKIENIEISGAKVIHEKFIEETTVQGLSHNYQPDDFYLAKQYGGCQWYGIINKWDVPRDVY